MKIEATFVISAAGTADFPRTGLPEVALVGRSNVGKSSLINALTRQRVARTSGWPGKTRLANIYRVSRGNGSPFHLVDLPGFGYAGGGEAAVREFDAVTSAYFGRAERDVAALLLVDVRHPGLESDLAAWLWLKTVREHAGIVATKVDKLARGARIRALGKLESVFEDAVLPVSAVTGEGLDELWRLIDNLANNYQPHPRRRPTPKAMAPRPPTE